MPARPAGPIDRPAPPAGAPRRLPTLPRVWTPPAGIPPSWYGSPNGSTPPTGKPIGPPPAAVIGTITWNPRRQGALKLSSLLATYAQPDRQLPVPQIPSQADIDAGAAPPRPADTDNLRNLGLLYPTTPPEEMDFSDLKPNPGMPAKQPPSGG